jgi:uncharacterized NAD(P)/FAD-binding protein YdhS
MVREVEKAGGDWREAVTFIRNLAPSLWRKLPEIERRRFVRHVQAHWDVHRHRLPPQLTARIEELRRRGRLRVNAGRIRHVIAVDGRLRVSWRPRGSQETAALTANLVVNATGPNYDIEHSADALFGSLRAAELVCADALNLGIRTARYGACVDAHGRSEATAALELRDHAERLAAHLADRSD